MGKCLTIKQNETRLDLTWIAKLLRHISWNWKNVDEKKLSKNKAFSCLKSSKRKSMRQLKFNRVVKNVKRFWLDMLEHRFLDGVLKKSVKWG